MKMKMMYLTPTTTTQGPLKKKLFFRYPPIFLFASLVSMLLLFFLVRHTIYIVLFHNLSLQSFHLPHYLK